MRLFISYAHVDKYYVQQVVEILRTGGHDPWFDHHLVIGQEWQAQLLDAIRQCDAFVYTLTPESVASEWCQWEFARAVELGKPIIPVLLQAKTTIPETLQAYQYADFSEGPTPEAVARLMGGLHSAMVRIPRENAPVAPENPAGRPAQAPPPAPAKERDRPRINVTQSATNSKNVTQIGELHGNLTLNQGDSYAAPPRTPAASSLDAQLKTDRLTLLNVLDERLGKDQLNKLIFAVGYSAANLLMGGTKTELAIALIEKCEREGKLKELAEKVYTLFPHTRQDLENH